MVYTSDRRLAVPGFRALHLEISECFLSPLMEGFAAKTRFDTRL